MYYYAIQTVSFIRIERDRKLKRTFCVDITDTLVPLKTTLLVRSRLVNQHQDN